MFDARSTVRRGRTCWTADRFRAPSRRTFVSTEQRPVVVLPKTSRWEQRDVGCDGHSAGMVGKNRGLRRTSCGRIWPPWGKSRSQRVRRFGSDPASREVGPAISEEAVDIPGRPGGSGHVAARPRTTGMWLMTRTWGNHPFSRHHSRPDRTFRRASGGLFRGLRGVRTFA